MHERARRGLLRSYQITSIFEEFTVLENAALSALGARGRALQLWRPMLADARTRQSAQEALAAAGLEARAQVPAGELGYGVRREWLGGIDGEEVPARAVGNEASPPIEDAPGSYVKVQD